MNPLLVLAGFFYCLLSSACLMKYGIFYSENQPYLNVYTGFLEQRKEGPIYLRVIWHLIAANLNLIRFTFLFTTTVLQCAGFSISLVFLSFREFARMCLHPTTDIDELR